MQVIHRRVQTLHRWQFPSCWELPEAITAVRQHAQQRAGISNFCDWRPGRCNRRRSIERCDASHHDQSPVTLCPHRGIVAIPVLGAAASLAPRRVTRTCPATAGAAAATSNATAAVSEPVALMPPRDSAPAIGRSSAWQRLFSAWIDAIAGARVHSSAGAAYNMGCPALISPTDGL
ncbi:hypothetical protein XCY_000582 [Xanthomonas arboricola pv. juglandis]|uniref:hypothetical protein n=1 Tax=Xanthomonas arboricola TaxID=56448 RepID=UPI001AF5E687|nr:hypothetical protein XCY_000582 [Xanthomonas arboricola pv. juglandis]